MTEQIKLEEFSISQLNNISGNHDENLKLIEDTFGISITLRGDELLLTGDNATNFDKAKKVIQTLIELVSKKITISRRDVVYALKLVEQDNLKHINEYWKENQKFYRFKRNLKIYLVNKSKNLLQCQKIKYITIKSISFRKLL